MELQRLNLIINEGKIVDASFVEVPRQRNKKDENEQLKRGEIPERFENKEFLEVALSKKAVRDF